MPLTSTSKKLATTILQERCSLRKRSLLTKPGTNNQTPTERERASHSFRERRRNAPPPKKCGRVA